MIYNEAILKLTNAKKLMQEKNKYPEIQIQTQLGDSYIQKVNLNSINKNENKSSSRLINVISPIQNKNIDIMIYNNKKNYNNNIIIKEDYKIKNNNKIKDKTLQLNFDHNPGTKEISPEDFYSMEVIKYNF